MKIGIMGLGNIFSKAYLPVISQHQDVQWHLYSSNKTKLEDLKIRHGFQYTFDDKEAFFASGITAVMIHTPTHTHYEFIKECLSKGLHVFVDKPISDDILETYELLQLANDLGLILMTGFNRRYAPLTQKIKAVPQKSMIVVRKNRTEALQNKRFALYDMMIHVVDTALYLLDDPVINYKTQLHLDDNDHIISATLTINTAITTLLAYMNMQSGSRKETFEVMSPQGHYIVEDMNQMLVHKDTDLSIESFSDWEPTLSKRGFPQMIDDFIKRIYSNDQSCNQKAILTHEIIEDFLSPKS